MFCLICDFSFLTRRNLQCCSKMNVQESNLLGDMIRREQRAVETWEQRRQYPNPPPANEPQSLYVTLPPVALVKGHIQYRNRIDPVQMATAGCRHVEGDRVSLAWDCEAPPVAPKPGQSNGPSRTWDPTPAMQSTTTMATKTTTTTTSSAGPLPSQQQQQQTNVVYQQRQYNHPAPHASVFATSNAVAGGDVPVASRVQHYQVPIQGPEDRIQYASYAPAPAPALVPAPGYASADYSVPVWSSVPATSGSAAAAPPVQRVKMQQTRQMAVPVTKHVQVPVRERQVRHCGGGWTCDGYGVKMC